MLPGILEFGSGRGRFDIHMELSTPLLLLNSICTNCKTDKWKHCVAAESSPPSMWWLLPAVAGRKQQGNGEGVKNEVTNRSRQAFFSSNISVR